MQGSSVTVVTVVTVGLMFHYRGNNFPAEAVFFLNKSAVFIFFSKFASVFTPKQWSYKL